MSLIIFGWGRTKVREYGPIIPIKCGHCNNLQGWVLKKISVWFTLFFIPVFPYKISYLLCCPICLWSHKLTKGKFNALVPIAKVNVDYFTKKITDGQHEAMMKKLKLEEAISFLGENQ